MNLRLLFLTVPAIRMTETYFRNDPMESSRWVAALPEGERRDWAAQALSHLVSRGSKADFDAGVEWAESVGDQKLREASLTTVFQQMLRDPSRITQTEAMIRQSSLPEAAQSRLLEKNSATR